MGWVRSLDDFLGFFSCDGNNTCGSSAKVIYNLGYPNCTFLIDINGSLFEPTNISQWDTFLFYFDTEDVYIAYPFLIAFSSWHDCYLPFP